jgi:hypothetical protein
MYVHIVVEFLKLPVLHKFEFYSIALQLNYHKKAKDYKNVSLYFI